MSTNSPRYFTPLFQRQLLALLLQNPETFGRFSGIWSHTYFNEIHHRTIAGAYIKIRQAGGEHPTGASLSQELFGDFDPRAPLTVDQQALASELEALYQISTANLDYSLKEVRAWAQSQALINAINESVDLLQTGKTAQIRPTIDRALAVGADMLHSGITLNASTRNPSSVLAVAGERGLPTGLATIDKYFNGGGIRAGEMMTIVGGPGVFKSGTLLNFSIPALQQPHARKVTYITLEMPETQVYARYCYRITQRGYKSLFNDTVGFDAAFNKAITNYAGALHIKGFGSCALDLPGLKTYLDFLDSKGHETELLIVDYPQIMAKTGLGSQEKDYISTGLLYAGVRALASERSIPVIVAAQANRDALKSPETLALHHISATMDISRHSDFILAIIQTDEERSNNRLRFKLLKNRNEISGIIVQANVNYELYELYGDEEWKPEKPKEEASEQSFADTDKAANRRAKAAASGGGNSHPIPVGSIYRSGGIKGLLAKHLKKRESDTDSGRTR